MSDNTMGTNRKFAVRGTVRLADGSPAAGVKVSAFDRDLRTEQLLGQSTTGRDGSYRIQYSGDAFATAETGGADLVIKAFATDGALLAASPVLFNAPPSAEIDLTIPAEALLPPTLFEKVGRALTPLLGKLRVADLEEDARHQDVSFLSGETGFERTVVSRFVMARRGRDGRSGTTMSAGACPTFSNWVVGGRATARLRRTLPMRSLRIMAPVSGCPSPTARTPSRLLLRHATWVTATR